ncbi:hypothetical protein KC19_9G090400 [Ceratodon purpureus]|uniref:Uncharacterized protein n=1 Tax=Ceratodon purpureus TaxID=3225 RepID=A0A8T0GVQ3_CERPU|nr:hypothetical protein KC19_9G090400 [Ceratodon purpureus]
MGARPPLRRRRSFWSPAHQQQPGSSQYDAPVTVRYRIQLRDVRDRARTMIRFASGMGPGSAHHAHMLASSSPSSSDQDKTLVTLGTNFINYGTTGASGTYGAIHHLYDMCHEGACDSSPSEVDTILASDVAEQDAKLVLSADDHYDGWGERDAYVEAVLVAAAQGESCKRQTWTQYGPNGQIYETGTRQQCSQTSFISVDKWCNDKKILESYIQVKVAIDQSSTLASCSKVTGVFASIISMVGAIAGPYAERLQVLHRDSSAW